MYQNPPLMKSKIFGFLYALFHIISVSAQNQSVTTTYLADKIYQSDTAFSVSQAMVVQDGVILFVGSAHLADSLYPNSKQIRYEGKVIYPGFIDAHCHFLAYSKGLTQVDLTGTKSEIEVIKRLKKFQKKNKLTWIIGRGWDQNDWPGIVENGTKLHPFPNMVLLNKAFSNSPICLSRIDGHAVWINQAAINKLHLNPDSLIEGGEFVNCSFKGQKGTVFSGICIDKAADWVKSKLPEIPFSAWENGLKKGLQNCYAQGLTTLDEAGMELSDVELIRELQKNGTMEMRIYGMLVNNQTNLAFASVQGMIFEDKLTVRAMKFYLDGALGSRGALLKTDYCDQLHHRGLQLLSIPEFEMYQQLCLNRGYQVCVHAIGDSANAIALKTFNRNIPENYDARWRIEHAQVVSGKDQKLFANRGVIPSVQPTHATSDAAWADERLCNTSKKGGYAYQNLLKYSNLLALGTDFPVESISTLNTFYSATQRMDAAGHLKKPFIGEQALTRKEALWGMTLWAAYANFDESRTGSLEASKLADFVVMDSDIMTINSSKIPKAKVLATYIGGKMVYPKK